MSKYIAWMMWKNPDEVKSRIMDETHIELNLTVKMGVSDFAEFMKKYSRKDFIIEFSDHEPVVE